MNIINVIKAPLMLLVVVIAVGACSKQNSVETADKSLNTTMEKTSNELKKDSQKVHAYIDDAAITASVNAAILAEPGINVFDINVVTDSGVATLKGTVDSSEVKDKTEILVASIEGVKRVNNKLVVELDE